MLLFCSGSHLAAFSGVYWLVKMGLRDTFSVQVFFIILRETLETAIIISVLLLFINQGQHQLAQPDAEVRGLKLQVWVGALAGLLVCFFIGLGFIAAFYLIGKDLWFYAERIWEGVFCLLSSVIITVMGIGLLRINKVMKVKWFMKLGNAYEADSVLLVASGSTAAAPNTASTGTDLTDLDDLDTVATGTGSGPVGVSTTKKVAGRKLFGKKYYLAILPLMTTLREGLEAVVFVGGAGMTQSGISIVNSIVAGVLCGSIIGYSLYRGGNKLSLQYFLILSTCFLYIVSAGLMSRGVWFLELEKYVQNCGGVDVSETGNGPGSYDVANTIWHVNCCNGLRDGWWMVLNALVGWSNTATYGSVFSYCGYWLFVIVWLELKLYQERNGYLPVIPIKWQLKQISKRHKILTARRNIALTHQPINYRSGEERQSVDKNGGTGDINLSTDGEPMSATGLVRSVSTSIQGDNPTLSTTTNRSDGEQVIVPGVDYEAIRSSSELSTT